jgi:D-alanine-D-alanine ligase
MILLRVPGTTPWRSRATYNIIECSLAKKWKKMRAIHASTESDLFARLARRGSDPHRTFVFNIAEYLDEKRKCGFLPDILEAWGYLHLGSSAATVRMGLDKGRTKEILNRLGIPTPRFFVAQPGHPDLLNQATAIGFPLFVKPLREGGHRGVSQNSIVRDIETLERVVEHVFRRHHQPAMVEGFIGEKEAREFSVGIVDSKTRFYFPIEIDWDSMDCEERILSEDRARRGAVRVKPVKDRGLRGVLREMAGRTFDAVGAKDYARIDIRADSRGLFVLEINIMPGLGPGSFLPRAAFELLGIDHGDMIRRIAAESMSRQGFVEPVG